MLSAYFTPLEAQFFIIMIVYNLIFFLPERNLSFILLFLSLSIYLKQNLN